MTRTAKTKTAADERRELEKDALRAAIANGHRMSDFATSYGDRVKSYSEAYCFDCSMVVAVNSRPDPKSNNQSRIGGFALAYECSGKWKAPEEESAA
jgi:hypothetical protein